MNKLSLFSGIGGDDLASEWAGIETVCFVERDKYCQQVLHKHWPDIPIIEDVKDVTKEKVSELTHTKTESMENTGSRRFGKSNFRHEQQGRAKIILSSASGIDIISGGFPCQPHSVAGKRKGSADDRNLWPEFRRIIGEFKPGWVVGENVPGLFTSDGGRFFNGIISDLAKMGYSVGWCTYGAVDVGALHRRNRVFIVAYAGSSGDSRGYQQAGETESLQGKGLEWAEPEGAISTTGLLTQCSDVPDTNGGRCQQCDKRLRSIPEFDPDYWSVEPNVGRVANGIPSRVDRLKGLGNAVVPQAIYPIYKAIVEIESLQEGKDE